MVLAAGTVLAVQVLECSNREWFEQRTQCVRTSWALENIVTAGDQTGRQHKKQNITKELDILLFTMSINNNIMLLYTLATMIAVAECRTINANKHIYNGMYFIVHSL